ncbi:hypothetical protein I79_003867 [Cricetulus griseus]|uniref:Uncharacterized protein n=1 Tax=Cricetulus griseus TaxID=10029 RepID=G3H143_CRIGR|nr:hypothetical protein I79_003867 [Cricetulus griseus]
MKDSVPLELTLNCKILMVQWLTQQNNYGGVPATEERRRKVRTVQEPGLKASS